MLLLGRVARFQSATRAAAAGSAAASRSGRVPPASRFPWAHYLHTSAHRHVSATGVGCGPQEEGIAMPTGGRKRGREEASDTSAGEADYVVRAIEAATTELCARLGEETFAAPVTHVYNPLEYAREPFLDYVSKWAGKGVEQTGSLEVLLVGMNPGPFGMAQTGVPFGDSSFVREWLRVEGAVSAPERMHPKRQVYGLSCPKGEVSGQRLWGWARQTFGAPEAFFSRFFVYNYCPLVFMEASGRNRTPDKLKADERARVEAACDEALEALIKTLRPKVVVGVGKFAEKVSLRVVSNLESDTGESPRVGCILHPSPASPAANKNWAEKIEQQMREMGLEV